MRLTNTIYQASLAAIALAALLVLAPNIWSLPQGAQDADSKATQEQGTIRVPLPKGKKLVLVDGTFHLVREYSVQGDRVRYWSVERSDWEEIPTALVNWDATHKAEAEQSQQDADLKAKIRASDLAERAKGIDVDRSLEMKQSLAVTKLSKGREVERILSGVPLIPRKMTLEIRDAHAALRLITAEPEFFMRPADEREPRFRLLRVQVKGDHRVVENISIHITGDQTHHADVIFFDTSTT